MRTANLRKITVLIALIISSSPKLHSGHHWIRKNTMFAHGIEVETWSSFKTSSGWCLEHFYFFHSVGNVIIPTDELIFFRGVGIPPTRWLLTIINHIITININHILTVYSQPMVGRSTTNQSCSHASSLGWPLVPPSAPGCGGWCQRGGRTAWGKPGAGRGRSLLEVENHPF